jgi:hypothetical protein
MLGPCAGRGRLPARPSIKDAPVDCFAALARASSQGGYERIGRMRRKIKGGTRKAVRVVVLEIMFAASFA